MRSTLIACCVAVTVATVAATAAPAGASVKVHHCADFTFKPQFKRISAISIRGGACTEAHGVALAYENAITSESGPHAAPNSGICFGAKSFGRCDVTWHRRTYACNRPNAAGGALPAVCTRAAVRIRFRG